MTAEPDGQSKDFTPQLRKRVKKTTQYPDRRSEILGVSARLFAEYGFETTSVRQIADAVDILAGSLYHHFETKEAILHEIIRAPSVEIAADIERVSKLPIDAEHRLIASVVLRFHHYMLHWEIHAILQNDAKFFRRQEDFAYVPALKSRNYQIQEDILKEGMDAGLFRPEMNTYLMISMIARIVSSAANWYRSGETTDSAHAPETYTFETVVDFHLDGILRLVRLPSRLGEPVPMAYCTELALQKPAL
jgi:AcrR family transcriptional regulator